MADIERTRPKPAGQAEDLIEIAEAFAANDKTLRLLSSITERMPDSVISTDLDYRITYVNPAFEKMYGYSRDELLGQYPIILNASPNAGQIQKDIHETVSSGGVWHGETENRRKDGSTFPCELAIFSLKDEEGNVCAYVGRQRDITELKNAEEALRRSEEKYRGLVEYSSDWIWEVNAEGFYTYASPQVKAVLGYKPEEVIGKTPFDLMPPEEAQRLGEVFLHLRETGKPLVALENVNLHKDGRRVVLETSGIPVFDEAGKIAFYRGVDRDITDRKRAEEQLEIAKQRAEAANIAKSQFLANMSHEIRTPMTVITGFADLLRYEKDPDEQKRYIDLIRNAGKSLLRIIDEILDISRIEAGELEISMAECSLDALLSGVAAMMRPLAREAGLQFVVFRSGDLPAKIRTDRDRVRQCLINLIGNAIKFTREGHVRLKVYLEEKEGRSLLNFDVEDTGIGIPQDKREAIFEAFSQADGSHTRQYGGTGLGLAITRQLAELLGGELSFTSEEGEGSVFSLAIPAAVDAKSSVLLNNDEQARKASAKSAITDNLRFSGKVLVAEDDEGNRILADKMLKRYGLEVEVVEDGKRAVERARQESFDVILMDMQMPVLNGLEATRILRDEGIATPIIAFTAYAMQEERDKCVAAGCSDYMSKPVDQDELRKVLSKYVSDGTVSA